MGATPRKNNPLLLNASKNNPVWRGRGFLLWGIQIRCVIIIWDALYKIRYARKFLPMIPRERYNSANLLLRLKKWRAQYLEQPRRRTLKYQIRKFSDGEVQGRCAEDL